MPYTLTRDRVLLCEGSADRAFIQKLVVELALPEFDIPFPQADRANGERVLAGRDAFGLMLRSIRAVGPQYPLLKAVLIVADSGNDWKETFGKICNQIRTVGSLGIPRRPLELAKSDEGHPRVGVLLLPGRRPGSLETLCVEAIGEHAPELIRCVDEYLKCGPIVAGGWEPEKRDKARLQCLIAATNREDPNKTLRWAFDDIVPLGAKSFSRVKADLARICSEITGVSAE